MLSASNEFRMINRKNKNLLNHLIILNQEKDDIQNRKRCIKYL